MKDLAPYLYPLLIAALVLLNYVMQRIAKWQKKQPSAEPEEEETEPAPDEMQQRLEKLKRQREQLQQKRKQAQGERAEPTALRPERTSERNERVRAVRDEPLETRLARARASRPELPAPPALRARRASGIRALLADRRSLRQAFVLTTVLGPCRANARSG